MKLELKNKENVYISKTRDKGKTYFAKKNFKKGETIFFISGPIVFSPTDYTIPIGFGMFINPLDYGGMFLNDYGRKANLGIKDRTQLIAMRNIKKGEEVGPAYFMFVPFFIKNSIADKLNLTCFKNLSQKEIKKHKRYISDYLFNKKEVKMYNKFLK
jgi:hypothetical protein